MTLNVLAVAVITAFKVTWGIGERIFLMLEMKHKGNNILIFFGSGDKAHLKVYFFFLTWFRFAPSALRYFVKTKIRS